MENRIYIVIIVDAGHGLNAFIKHHDNFAVYEIGLGRKAEIVGDLTSACQECKAELIQPNYEILLRPLLLEDDIIIDSTPQIRHRPPTDNGAKKLQTGHRQVCFKRGPNWIR